MRSAVPDDVETDPEMEKCLYGTCRQCNDTHAEDAPQNVEL